MFGLCGLLQLAPALLKHVIHTLIQSCFACCAAELVKEQQRVSLLSGHSSCINVIVKDAQDKWPSYAQLLVSDVAVVLESFCNKLCSQYFHDHPGLAELMK
jgi:hypothetical protein